MEKSINERIDLTVGVEKAVKLEHGEVEVIVSNSGVDRHGESIAMEGIDLKEIKRNPVVLWAHDYSRLPIAAITKLWKSAGNLMARVKFAVDDYDFADTVYRLVVGGFINAVSIGGIVKEWNEDYTIIKKMEMIELSVVPVGAHPDALVVAKNLGIEKEDLTKQYNEFLLKSYQAKASQIPAKDMAAYTEMLKTLAQVFESIGDNSSKSPQETIERIVIRVI